MDLENICFVYVVFDRIFFLGVFICVFDFKEVFEVSFFLIRVLVRK